MFKMLVYLFFTTIGAIFGYTLGPEVEHVFPHVQLFSSRWFGLGVGALLFLAITLPLGNYIVALIRWMEMKLQKTPLVDLLSGTLGIVIGLVVSYLLTPSIRFIPLLGQPIQFFVTIVLVYLGFRVGITKREDILALVSGRLQRKPKEKDKLTLPVSRIEEKFLDTSVIIDGRIADLVSTGFIEGPLLVPSFVLQELQYIADSADDLKRARGRRGLDVLNAIQKDAMVEVSVIEHDYPDIAEVDTKLMRIAKDRNGKVLTNDFNLNKVCAIHEVPVLNINDLANAIKPIMLHGETLEVLIIKTGKEDKQGVAYLDDGTMVVVEGGSDHVGELIQVVVTSILQTSAGRMIFARVNLLDQAL